MYRSFSCVLTLLLCLYFRQKESSNQEVMVNKFQMSLQQLQEKVRGQEEVGPPPQKKTKKTKMIKIHFQIM